jgi:hypothetical protein
LSIQLIKKIMKPKFKVVKKRTRMSAIVHGNSKYALKYPKGETVYAMDGTNGVFTFTNKAAAQAWIDVRQSSPNCSESEELIILTVIPVARGKKIDIISSEITTKDLDAYYKGEGTLMEGLDSVMGYPAVLVLD